LKGTQPSGFIIGADTRPIADRNAPFAPITFAAALLAASALLAAFRKVIQIITDTLVFPGTPIDEGVFFALIFAQSRSQVRGLYSPAGMIPIPAAMHISNLQC